ncbi:MAG: C40 family peptidase [Deltaproteobacteria bacterium]|nr:C40 family peptidase [Deltaproteobacteria bacterium]
MAFTIQAGAFSRVENAARLTAYLNNNDLNAYYFVYKKGLYKVRFGDFSTKERAREKAEHLLSAGIIEDYYILRPEDYTASKKRKYGEIYVRDELAKTAESFIGVPYQWGGASPQKGFDCSGLTMAVYRLNGFNLPRTSRAQYTKGTYVKGGNLSKGDLVFFAISGKGAVSHVGIYVGGNAFIHAPGSGKRVRRDTLTNGYYKKRYRGARTYL